MPKSSPLRHYKLGTISVPFVADNRRSELAGRLELARGYRRIGGDQGDVHFTRFVSGEQDSEVFGVTFASAHADLTEEEARIFAFTAIMESFASIGAECLEHS